jgi:deoxyribonuclease-4
MSVAGGYHKAIDAAHAVRFETVQLFTKNNNQWKAPPITSEQAAAFRESIESTGIVQHVSHASYLINLGSPDEVLWRKSIEAMAVEVSRCGTLGIDDLVVHPGAHVGSGEEAALTRIAHALDEVARLTEGVDVRIDLETTAGQGSTIGHRFEHLRRIIDLCDRPERLGVCVDTCHIFAAGYPLETRGEYDGTIEDLDRIVGLDRIRVWHLNDSCRDRGSRVDRHAAIGCGKMGLEPFRHLVNDPRFRALPLILETPKGVDGGEDLDARNLRVLSELIATSPAARGPTSARRRSHP